MDFPDALAYLASHVNLETDPRPAAAERRLDRMRRLVGFMADPQASYPVIHLTGTNGKGSTARMVTAVLANLGLSVGTYTSPHLERVNERLAWSGQPIVDADLADVITAVAEIEAALGEPLTHFEILTAAAFRWFADVAVDVAVVEVGLGGRWDVTNVADADVAVVTNVALDHAETIGPTLEDIAHEKAGIVKPASTLVLGETGPALAPIFRDAGAARVWERGRDFGWTRNRPALSGRALDLFTPDARYPELFVPAYGAYQGDNAAAAVAGAEAFLGRPLAAAVVTEGLAAARFPCRIEVVGRRPLVILDGAHNPAGAAAATGAIDEAFGDMGARVLVVGLLHGRDPAEMLGAFGASRARLVVTCPPPSPRAQPAEVVAAAARAAGVAEVVAAPSVEAAVDLARERVTDDGMVVVTGSLYVVGAARAHLRAGSGVTGGGPGGG